MTRGVSEFFDRTWIINLPQRRDRRRQTERELRAAGMPLQHGRVEFFPGIRPADAAGFPSIGCHGCFRSHLEVLRQAMRQKLQSVLVLEDDIAFVHGFESIQATLVERLSGCEWDIIYFGYQLESPAMAAVDARDADLAFARYDGPLTLLHCYAVHGRVLGRLVAFMEAIMQRPAGHPDGGPMFPDGAHNVFRRQNPDVVTLLSAPPVAHQRSSRSDIASTRWYDRTPGTRALAEVVRRAREIFRG